MLKTTFLGKPAFVDSRCSVAFSPDGLTLATAGELTGLELWDIATRNLRKRLDGKRNGMAVVFSPEGRLVAASADIGVRLWDTTSAALFSDHLAHNSTVLSIAFSPDVRMLASAGGDGRVKLWDILTGRCEVQKLLHPHEAWVGSVAFSPNGRLLASGCNNGSIYWWNTLMWKLRGRHVRAAFSSVKGLAFSPDGRLLASWSLDETIKVHKGDY